MTPEPMNLTWRRELLAGGRVAWWLGNTGYRVEQCSDPPGPWIGIDPEGNQLLEARGRGFRHLSHAKSWVLEDWLEYSHQLDQLAPPERPRD
jgi:hypothetical protein